MQRISYIDTTRGLLLALMAIDHVRSFIHKSHPAEWWGIGLPQYNGDLIAFLSRIVTHACPPGFFFLMGISMSLLYLARQEKMPTLQIRKHFVIRGSILILVQTFIVNIAWVFGSLSAEVPKQDYGILGSPGVGGQIVVYMGVLASLGVSMIVSAGLISLRTPSLLIIFLLLQSTSVFLIVDRVVSEDTSVLLRIIGVPGQAGFWMVRYSVLPWLALTVLGIIVGRMIHARRLTAAKLAIAGGVAFTVFVMFRVLNIGDYNNPLEAGFIGLFNVTKYPASISYQLFSFAIIFVLMALSIRWQGRWQIVFNTFGKATLCFYVVHLYLYAAFGYLFPRGGAWGFVYFFWLIGLLILWWVCRWWCERKARTPKEHFIHYF